MALFSKCLTETDIRARLTIPMASMPHFQIPNHENTNHFDIPVVDSEGHEWTFRCSTRPRGHPILVISGGWLEFVRANGLLVNDEVTFYEEYGAGKVRLMVKGKKGTIKLFGGLVTDKRL